LANTGHEETAVKVLTAALTGEQSADRCDAADALGEMGPKAKAAVPALIAMAKKKTGDDQFLDRAAARQALRKIDPQAAQSNVVNDRLKHPTDAPTIGLILCQMQDKLLAVYSFAGIDKPIGVSTYELTRSLPKRMQSALPTVEEIEAELGEVAKKKKPSRKKKGGDA
jgi:hypothetical protein